MGQSFWGGDRQNSESHRPWSCSSSSQSRKKKKSHDPSPQGCLPSWPKPSCVTGSQGPHRDPIQHLHRGAPAPCLQLGPLPYLSFVRKSKPALAPLHPGPGLAWRPVLWPYLMARPLSPAPSLPVTTLCFYKAVEGAWSWGQLDSFLAKGLAPCQSQLSGSGLWELRVGVRSRGHFGVGTNQGPQGFCR